MGAATRKQYLAIGGRPVLGHTLAVFDGCPGIERIVLVAPVDDLELCRRDLLKPLALQTRVVLVAGGKQRQESVYNGLQAICNDTAARAQAGVVAIHDGVRPFVRPQLIENCLTMARRHGACILGIPAFDTLKQVNDCGEIKTTLDRRRIWLAQTPQAFRFDLILRAHEQARCNGYQATDDASLVEQSGHPVKIVTGSRDNIKITTPEDLELAQAIFSRTLTSTPLSATS